MVPRDRSRTRPSGPDAVAPDTDPQPESPRPAGTIATCSEAFPAPAHARRPTPRSPSRWPRPPRPPPTAPTRPPSATSTPGARARPRATARMKDLLGGKGAGLAEMTDRRPADAARLHDHDRGLQRLLRGRRAAPGRPLGRRPRGDARGRAPVRQGLRRPDEPAPRQRPLRRQVLDARDDGHGPQPRPQRGDARRA